MSVRVVTFVISDLETGGGVGQAVIAPSARYASVAWRGATRPDRRLLPANAWAELEAALALGVPPGPLADDSPFVRAIVPAERRTQYSVQYVGVLDLDVSPEQTAERLDALLRSLAA